MDQQSLPPAERYITLPPGVPKWTLGWEAIRWGSRWLRQPDGPNAGQRWKFIESQVRFLLWYYSLDEQGRWWYTHGVRRLPKGAGKSPFAAVMSIIELCAPVRFSHWEDDPRSPGGKRPVGKPVGMPLVQIAATAESQGIVNTMRMVRALAKKGSPLAREYELEIGKTIIYKPGGGQLHVVTSSAAAQEGALTTFAIADQTELWTATSGGHDLFEVLDRNLGKQKNRMIETSNAWCPGEDSIAERTFDAWVVEQEGRTRGRAKTLMDIRAAPPDSEAYICEECAKLDCKDHPRSGILDRDKLLEGVRIAYGDCHWADPEDIVDTKILDPKVRFEVSKQYYLNWPQSAHDAWIDIRQWTRWADPSIRIQEGDDIALGFDGSIRRDATSLIGCRISDGFVFDLGTWETDWGDGMLHEIPVQEVDDAVARAFELFNPVAFFADVREWESFTKIDWPNRYGERLKTWSVPGGRDPQPIAWDMRVHVQEFTLACEMVEGEITGDTMIFQHDGSSVIGRHCANARRRPNKHGVSIGKETHDSPKKIDACVSMIIARHARRLYLGNKDTKKDKKPSRVWSFSLSGIVGNMRKTKIALVAILASLVSFLGASGVALAVTPGGDDDGGYSSSVSQQQTPSPAPNQQAAASPSSSSGGGGFNVPGVPASFVACVAWRESGNGLYSSNVFGIIPASGYNGYALSLSGQEAAFAALYAQYGTHPWAPYDGC